MQCFTTPSIATEFINNHLNSQYANLLKTVMPQVQDVFPYTVAITGSSLGCKDDTHRAR